MVKDITDNTKPLWLIVNGSLQSYCGNTDVAFKYFTKAFFNQTDTKHSDIDWKYVIENNFKNLSKSFHKHPDDIENQYSKICSTEILENAWIQWAILIENNFNRLAVKDINIALAAMKCYIIASQLTSNNKSNIIIARVCIN